MGTPSRKRYTPNLRGSTDPTATKTLRDRWSGDFGRRFRELRGAIRTSIVDNDCFGLRSHPAGPVERGVTLSSNQVAPAKRNQFDFPRDDAKLQAFMDWLEEQERQGIIERTPNPVPGYTSPTSAVANEYLRPSYSKGARHAEIEAHKAGLTASRETLEFVFRSPRHSEASALIFSRSYRELTGITDAMDQQISRALAAGLAQGHSPSVMARNINQTVAGVGMKRANLIAQTESIRAFNEAALNRFEELGVQEVAPQVELLTAGDSRVCQECQALESDGPYTIQAARGLIPVHPSCRCTWVVAV